VHHVATRPPATLLYSRTPGFAAMESSQLSAEFYRFLGSIVPNPGDGMWYTSTQSFGNRLEATALAVGADCLVAANGVKPMRRVGIARNGRPQLRGAGPWDVDYVKIPFAAGTCHVSRLTADANTVAGGTRPGIDSHPEIARYLSNLPAVVQDHLESYVPSRRRIRRWVRSLGPTTVEPERFWLFTTSAEELAYIYGARWHRQDPSGLARDPASAPWDLTVLTAVIGPTTRVRINLAAQPCTGSTSQRPNLVRRDFDPEGGDLVHPR
jgi:hypothetical protein